MRAPLGQKEPGFEGGRGWSERRFGAHQLRGEGGGGGSHARDEKSATVHLVSLSPLIGAVF
jgi:hypothetical protein